MKTLGTGLLLAAFTGCTADSTDTPIPVGETDAGVMGAFMGRLINDTSQSITNKTSELCEQPIEVEIGPLTWTPLDEPGQWAFRGELGDGVMSDAWSGGLFVEGSIFSKNIYLSPTGIWQQTMTVTMDELHNAESGITVSGWFNSSSEVANLLHGPIDLSATDRIDAQAFTLDSELSFDGAVTDDVTMTMAYDGYWDKSADIWVTNGQTEIDGVATSNLSLQYNYSSGCPWDH